jgi:hypothetical protein
MGPPSIDLQRYAAIGELHCATSGGFCRRRQLWPFCPNQASEILGLARPSAPSELRSGLTLVGDLDRA